MARDAFRRWMITPGTSLGVNFRPGEDRCGIYILEFTDGQRYVGQSRDVVRRFADHSRRHLDIVAVQFCPTPLHDLDAAERQMVQDQRDAGHHLRNIDLVSNSWADSVLDAVVDQEIQQGWATGAPQTHPDDTRMLIARRRQSTRAQYEALQQHPGFDAVFDDICTYIDRVVAWPSATDGAFWTLSALPSTGKTRESRRLACVNCGRVETFVIFENRISGNLSWFLNIEHGVLSRQDLPRMKRRSLFTTNGYRSVGLVDRIEGGVSDSLDAWLDDTPNLEIAARQLSLNLMRKGRSWFARFHCDDFVDDVLLALEDTTLTPAASPGPQR